MRICIAIFDMRCSGLLASSGFRAVFPLKYVPARYARCTQYVAHILTCCNLLIVYNTGVGFHFTVSNPNANP